MWCIVNLPNGTQQAVECDHKAIGQECLEKVCKALGIICEMEYFGLEHWTPNQVESRTRQWINLRNRLTQDSGSGSGVQLMLALRVKFWVPVHYILQESVRNLFYMQAKVDLIEGRLNAKDWSNAAKLSALLCQADGIRFNQAALSAKCPIRFKFEQEQKRMMALPKFEKKDKDHVLTFKKRRLSKQKSIETLDVHPHPHHQSLDSALPSTSAYATHPLSNASSTPSLILESAENQTDPTLSSPLQIYESYLIRTNESDAVLPDEFLRQIAVEHEKLAKLKMAPKSAKYWLLQEIQDLTGYGEEVFTGFTGNESSVRCDIAVGAHGITVCTGDEKNNIPFSAIAAAKSFRRTFKLEYVDDHNDRKELEVKLQKHAIAAGIYRSITERHAFYVCEKVRVVVTTQFTRDLKGTIASMFKEDTELGKRYVFDIQRTCREAHDQARRTLYERGIEVTAPSAGGASDDVGQILGQSTDICAGKIDMVIKEKEEREAVIERCVDTRISEAMTCKICMDRTINCMFNPCGHVMACSQCSARCDRCPNCREKITNVVKIFLPSELRTSNTTTPATNVTTPPNASNTSNDITNADSKSSSTSVVTVGIPPPPPPQRVTKITATV